MSFFGWALVFIGLGLAAIALFVLLGLRLWRQIKVLGRDAASAGDRAAAIMATASRRR
jgi:hypothetical protein